MSPRPPTWWKEPLIQWCREVAVVLLDYGEERGDTSTATQIRFSLVMLDKLLKDSTVRDSLRQLLGKNGPTVKTSRPRVSVRRRKVFQPPLAMLALNADLRARNFSSRYEVERLLLDQLLPKQRLRVCAAGYLLLVAALASQSVPMGVSEERWIEFIAAELIAAVDWLYGQPRPRTVVTLVEAVTGQHFEPSSMRWRAKQPPRSIRWRAKQPP
jgi:hypothetical protein